MCPNLQNPFYFIPRYWTTVIFCFRVAERLATSLATWRRKLPILQLWKKMTNPRRRRKKSCKWDDVLKFGVSLQGGVVILTFLGSTGKQCGHWANTFLKTWPLIRDFLDALLETSKDLTNICGFLRGTTFPSWLGGIGFGGVLQFDGIGFC